MNELMNYNVGLLYRIHKPTARRIAYFTKSKTPTGRANSLE